MIVQSIEHFASQMLQHIQGIGRGGDNLDLVSCPPHLVCLPPLLLNKAWQTDVWVISPSECVGEKMVRSKWRLETNYGEPAALSAKGTQA